METLLFLVTTGMLVATWVIAFEWWPRSHDADFRAECLSLRQRLQEAAVQGQIRPEHPAYRQLHDRLVGYGVLAERVSLPFLIALRYYGRSLPRTERATKKGLSAAGRLTIEALEAEATNAMWKHMQRKSLTMRLLAVKAGWQRRPDAPQLPQNTAEYVVVNDDRVDQTPLRQPVSTAFFRLNRAAQSEAGMMAAVG